MSFPRDTLELTKTKMAIDVFIFIFLIILIVLFNRLSALTTDSLNPSPHAGPARGTTRHVPESETDPWLREPSHFTFHKGEFNRHVILGVKKKMSK